jgi:2-polyprenyl-3-methyl-5-hydroxy-6-metoxy-1,4-benzoquinol methylase
MDNRSEQEILHGEKLAEGNTDVIWGWGTPAGRLRASRRAKLIIDGAQLNSSSQALEIGCGTGVFTEYFAQTNCSITAVEISQPLLQKAKERICPKDNVRFINQRFEDSLMDGLFDAVIGSSILHHLEIETSFHNIYKLLKPGGIMCFAEPNMLNPQVFAERKFRGLFPYVSPDETAFVRWSLKGTLKKAGFIKIKIIPFDWLHPIVPEKWINFVISLGDLLEKVPIVKEFSGSLLIKAVRPL